MRTSDGCILHLQLMRRVWGSFEELDLIGVEERLWKGVFTLVPSMPLPDRPPVPLLPLAASPISSSPSCLCSDLEPGDSWAGLSTLLFFFLIYLAASGLSCSAAFEILVPSPGMDPASPALQGRFLTTGPPGNPMSTLLLLTSLPFFLFSKQILPMYLFLSVLDLRCCEGLPLVVVLGFLSAVAPLVTECRLQGTGSVVVAPGLQSTRSIVGVLGLSYLAVCGIFWDQGLNPCLLH